LAKRFNRLRTRSERRPSAAIKADGLAMILLAAGKGTRFGQAPKCAQLINGVPLARYSVEASGISILPGGLPGGLSL